MVLLFRLTGEMIEELKLSSGWMEGTKLSVAWQGVGLCLTALSHAMGWLLLP